jgi:hypothetical protein
MSFCSKSSLTSNNFLGNVPETQFTCVLAYSINGSTSPYDIMRAAGKFQFSHEECVAHMTRRRLIVLIPAAAVPERRRSVYFGVRELQRHHIDVAQRVWNFATSFTLFDWLNRGDRR